MRAQEDKASSPQEHSRKGRAVPHSSWRTRTGSLHFLELFALKGGSSALHARFSPALLAPQQTAQQGTCLLHTNRPAPPFWGWGKGWAASTKEFQGLVTAQSWPVVPLPEASRQGDNGGRILHLPWAKPS